MKSSDRDSLVFDGVPPTTQDASFDFAEKEMASHRRIVAIARQPLRRRPRSFRIDGRAGEVDRPPAL